MKLMVAVLLSIVVVISSWSQPVEHLLSLKTAEGNISFFGTFADRNNKIVNHFFAVFSDVASNGNEKLVTLEHGILRDKEGISLLDLSSRDPAFLGFILFESYPTNNKYTAGIRLDPYFGFPPIGGDTFRIQWDSQRKTFQKNALLIP